MNVVRQQLLDVLLRYVSEMNAEGAVLRAVREAGLDAERLTYADLPRFVPNIERRIRLFVDPVRHARLATELGAIGEGRISRRWRTLVIQKETDISEVRMVAKALCEGVGARSFIVHKVVTIVSELARNIVHYTPGGTIQLSVIREKPQRLSIIAADSGPGIKNLEEILSGRYKSKTGMGRGLIGVKRLAEKFVINPGPPGVRLEVEVNL